MIFRRRRVRLEIEQRVLTLGLTTPVASAPIATDAQAVAAAHSPSASESHPPPANEGKSVTKESSSCL